MLKKFIPKKLRKLNRNILLASSLAIILIVTAGTAILLSKNKSNSNSTSNQTVSEIETAPTTKGSLTLYQGVAEVKSSNDWEPAKKDFEISPGMSVRTTGAASRAEITLEDGSVVRIDANTEIKFETLTASRVVIEQLSGYVYNRVLPSESRTFTIHTKNAQFQAAGTAFRTIYSGDEEAVEVYQSSVRETNLNLQAQEGEKLTVVNAVNPSKNEKVEKLSIETIKKDPFIVWNKELDLKVDKFKSSMGYLADFDGPPIKFTSPIEESTIEVGENDTKGTVQISGTTDKGAKLTVQSKSIAGSAPTEVAVDASGNFTTNMIDAALGRSVFEFVATDRVGNATTANVSFNFNKKATVSQSSISLTLDDNDDTGDSIKFGWVLDGLTTPDGVMLVYGKSASPTLGNAEKVKVATGNSYELKTKSLKGTYHFRVCRYIENSDSCDVYSNDETSEIK